MDGEIYPQPHPFPSNPQEKTLDFLFLREETTQDTGTPPHPPAKKRVQGQQT